MSDRRADYQRMIHSTRWQLLRRDKLNANPLCEECRLRSAREVHHIKPIEYESDEAERERLMFDFKNLMSLCHDCHKAIHKQLRYAHGRMWRQKRAEKIALGIEKLFGRADPRG